MGIKVDPRSGMIVEGPSRPSRFPPSPNGKLVKKSGNMFSAKLRGNDRPIPLSLPPIDTTPSPSQDERLASWALMVGKVIAEQLLPALSQPREIIREVAVGSTPTTQYSKPEQEYSVNIDESIIDVGIGKSHPLEKGKESGNIAKRGVQSDDIASTKKKLRALKGRG